MGSQHTAEILLDTPDVSVRSAADGEQSGETVLLSGEMFTDGLNKNAWGLTEQGAKAISSSLLGRDLTAGHPPVMGDGFTRSIHDGPGMPIGEVRDTSVTAVEDAVMADAGGGFTASYESVVADTVYAQKFKDGLLTGGDYGVSIGIMAEDDDAICSVCREKFTECDHRRGEIVDGDVAGPLYTSGEADHLAVVYVPAYDNASSNVDAEGAMLASSASEFFARTERAFGIGDFVTWGQSQGRVVDRKTDGCFNQRIDGDQEVCASDDEAVLLIELYESTEDGWMRTGNMVAHLEGTVSEWNVENFTQKSVDTTTFSEGDLVQWQAVPDLFGMIEHIDQERFVIMVGLHELVDGELVPTGFTITAGYGDLQPLDPSDLQPDDEEEERDDTSVSGLLVETDRVTNDECQVAIRQSNHE